MSTTKVMERALAWKRRTAHGPLMQLRYIARVALYVECFFFLGMKILCRTCMAQGNFY